MENSARAYFGFNTRGSYEELARIIRILEITYLLNNSQKPAIYNSVMLNRDPEFWFEMWKKNETMLFKAIAFFHEQQLIGIAPPTFIEYIISVFLAKPEALENVIFTSKVKKCALYLTLTANGFNKSNLDIVEKFHDLASQLKSGNTLQIPNFERLSANPNLTANKVLECTASISVFKAVSSILYQENPDGKFDRDILGNQINLNYCDLHSIYPKTSVNNFTKQCPFNSIANIIYLHHSSNNDKIKDKSPENYFSKLRKQIDTDKLAQRCEQNLIDLDEVSKINNESKALEFVKNCENSRSLLQRLIFQNKNQDVNCSVLKKETKT